MPAELAVTAGRLRIAIACAADGDDGCARVCMRACARVSARACMRACMRMPVRAFV